MIVLLKCILGHTTVLRLNLCSDWRCECC